MGAPRRAAVLPVFACLGSLLWAHAAFADDLPEPASEPRFARLWIGVSGALDLVTMPEATNVCKLSPVGQPLSSPAYYCTQPDGSDFPSRASPTQNDQLRGEAGHVDARLHRGDVRVMLAADYALTGNVLIGARVGYVLNTYTGTSAVQAGRALAPPVHLELRATYVFGRHPLSPKGGQGFAPMAFAGGGVSQFDASSTTTVATVNVAGTMPVTAWITNAPFFGVVGGGIRYAFSPRIAFTALARLNGVFGESGVLLTYGPELAVLYGF